MCVYISFQELHTIVGIVPIQLLVDVAERSLGVVNRMCHVAKYRHIDRQMSSFNRNDQMDQNINKICTQIFNVY